MNDVTVTKIARSMDLELDKDCRDLWLILNTIEFLERGLEFHNSWGHQFLSRSNELPKGKEKKELLQQSQYNFKRAASEAVQIMAEKRKHREFVTLIGTRKADLATAVLRKCKENDK